MLQRKICVVVGGANGRGCNVVERYASENYQIAFMDMDRESGNHLKKKLEQEYGSRIFFFHGDARSEEDLELFAGAIIGQYERVDCLFYHEDIVNDHVSIAGLLRGNLIKGGKMESIS